MFPTLVYVKSLPSLQGLHTVLNVTSWVNFPTQHAQIIVLSIHVTFKMRSLLHLN